MKYFLRLWVLSALVMPLVLGGRGIFSAPRSLAEAAQRQATWSSAAFGLLPSLLLMNPGIVHGASASASASASENSFQLLSSRALGGDALSYSPGIQSADVLYPSWFSGIWSVESTTASVIAPLGIDAFGGTNAWEAAQKDIGNTLKYKSRFFESEGAVIADRLFNVKAIASVAMGKGAVLGIGGDRSIPKVNNLKYYDGLAAMMNVAITPDQSQGDIFDCSLVTVGRSYASDSTGGFVAVEKVTQSISRRMDLLASQPTAPRIKEIETISLYKAPTGIDSVEAVQRTSTYLSPNEESSRYRSLVSKDARVRDTAVDMRTYHLSYKRDT